MMAKGTLAIPHSNERVSAGSPCWAREEGLLLDRQWVTTKGRPPGVRPSASRCERGWWSRDRAAGGLALARQGDWGPPHASPRFPTLPHSPWAVAQTQLPRSNSIPCS